MDRVQTLSAGDGLARYESRVPLAEAEAEGQALEEETAFIFLDQLIEPSSQTHIECEAGTFQSRSGDLANRLLDILVASVLLSLTLPLMMVCALAILCSGSGPIVFRHRRIGRDGREFVCLKFRTMLPDAERLIDRVLNADPEAKSDWSAVQKLHSDPRITPVGRFLRRYCLDELPQLFNVLAGDMSVVGPRPIVAAEISRYGPKYHDYCVVKPGLTGVWQTSGSHSLPYEERVRLDSEYARSKRVRTDLIILLKTVSVVLRGQNL